MIVSFMIIQFVLCILFLRSFFLMIDFSLYNSINIGEGDRLSGKSGQTMIDADKDQCFLKNCTLGGIYVLSGNLVFTSRIPINTTCSVRKSLW